MGIEIDRILSSKRRQLGEKRVDIVFCTGSKVTPLLDSIREKYLQREREREILTLKELFQRFQLGEITWQDVHENTVKLFARLGEFISQKSRNLIMVVDEVGFLNQNWRDLKPWPGLDLVVLPKQDQLNQKTIEPPESSHLIRTHQLLCTYRQAMEPFMAYKYLMSHAHELNELYSQSWAYDLRSDEEGRCPVGQHSVWIACEHGVSRIKALKTVEEIIENADKVAVINKEEPVDVDDHQKGNLNTAKDFCAQKGWIWEDDDIASISGSEYAVIIFASNYFNMKFCKGCSAEYESLYTRGSHTGQK